MKGSAFPCEEIRVFHARVRVEDEPHVEYARVKQSKKKTREARMRLSARMPAALQVDQQVTRAHTAVMFTSEPRCGHHLKPVN